MIVDFVDLFNKQAFGKVSALLNIRYFKPNRIGLQHVSVEKKIVDTTRSNRMKIGYSLDTMKTEKSLNSSDMLNSVDIQEIQKFVGNFSIFLRE